MGLNDSGFVSFTFIAVNLGERLNNDLSDRCSPRNFCYPFAPSIRGDSRVVYRENYGRNSILKICHVRCLFVSLEIRNAEAILIWRGWGKGRVTVGRERETVANHEQLGEDTKEFDERRGRVISSFLRAARQQ